MPVEFGKELAVFSDVVTVQEAEPLLEWLQSQVAPSHPSIDLYACIHLHSANLQVLMAARPAVSRWPQDAYLAAWLRSALRLDAADNDSTQGVGAWLRAY